MTRCQKNQSVLISKVVCAFGQALRAGCEWRLKQEKCTYVVDAAQRIECKVIPGFVKYVSLHGGGGRENT